MTRGMCRRLQVKPGEGGGDLLISFVRTLLLEPYARTVGTWLKCQSESETWEFFGNKAWSVDQRYRGFRGTIGSPGRVETAGAEFASG
jgi:hypothetical protein